MKKTAGQSIKGVKHPSIWASDADLETSARLGQCVDRCNLEDAVAVSHGNFFDLRPGDMGAPSSKPKGDRPGLIVLNPPYGQRLQARDDTQKRYADIAAKLKKDFRGWHAAVLVPGGVVAKKLGLSLRPMKIDHGGLKLTLLVGRL